MHSILRLIISVFLILTISVEPTSSASEGLQFTDKSISAADAYAWAPTGGSLIYATSDGTLWSAQRPDFTAIRIIKIALPNEQKIEQIVWSSDGRSIAVVSPRPNDLWDTIWLVDLTTSQLRDLLPVGAPFGGPGIRALKISYWFPDGRIAFVMHCGTGCVGSHAVQSKGGEQYWDFCDASGDLFWSPTRKNAVVQNGHSGAAPADLGLVSASDGVAVPRGASYYRPRRDCSSLVKGAPRGGVYFNAWFPDHDTVLFTDSNLDGSDLKLWNTASGSKTTLVPRGSSGSLSSDGRYVAFLASVHESSLSKQAWLRILDLRSKKIVASREIPKVLAPFQWSPSANYLAMLTDRKLLLARLTPAGIELRQTQLSEPDADHQLSWSPDGKFLAVWDEASGLKILSFN